MKNRLESLVQISPAGIEHPYYSVSPVASIDEKMYLRVASYPPLDHVTTVSHDKAHVYFHVLVEAKTADEQWEVDLWHNAAEATHWEALRLVPATRAPRFCSSDLSKEHVQRKWYQGKLQGRCSSPVSFTIRLRIQGEPAWRWVHEQYGTQDGQLIYEKPWSVIQGRYELSDFFDGLSDSLNVDKVLSETPDTELWSVTARAAPAKGDDSGHSKYAFGLPKCFVRWFSLVRLMVPWLAPRQGRTLPLAERDSILYAFLRDDGLHVVALAMSGMKDVLTVFSFEQDILFANARNDREEDGVAQIVVSVGKTFEKANAAAIYYARKTVSQYGPVVQVTQGTNEQSSSDVERAKASWVQDWVDGLSFCTWNSLGQNLTEDKILSALQSLEESGITITNLLIDDNWQTLDNEGKSQMVRGWKDFEANPKAFPRGLKTTVSNIRAKHSNIKHICVWHALLGYWGAISPEGKIAQTYKTIIVRKDDDEHFTVVDASDIKEMYYDFYNFLAASGVDSVKTDAQYFLDRIATAPARRLLTSTYLSVWMQAQLGHFAGKAISCMSQCPQILFSCQLPNNSPPIPVRNSDDFFPDVDASHPWHIFCNAHNALFTQHLNVLPDWDMFQTRHKWSGFHAAARCVSGGPIYITDKPGYHDVELISSMTATTCLGQTVVLRPSVVGRSREAYIGYEDERFCKIAAYDGASGTGSSILGVFNCRENSITEAMSLQDFTGIDRSKKYAIKHHHPPSRMLGIMSMDEAEDAVFGLILPGHGWDVLSATPAYGPYDVSADLRDVTVANLGLLGKITGAVAIVKTEVSVHPSESEANFSQNAFSSALVGLYKAMSAYSRLRVRTTMKALGTLGLFIPKIEEIDWEDRILALIEDEPMPATFARKSEHDRGVLELDVAGAWSYLGLSRRWSNEVDIEVLIR